MGILEELSRPSATFQKVIGDTLLVKFSDDTYKSYDAIKMGCEWFKMSNDAFYEYYGFNFNPHQFGLFERCRKIVHGGLLIYG